MIFWLVGFGLNGPLRQYFSLYRAVSQREGERGEKGEMRIKTSKQPPPAPTASAVGPCPTVIQIVGRPGTGSLPSTIAPLDHPLILGEHNPEKSIILYCFIVLCFGSKRANYIYTKRKKQLWKGHNVYSNQLNFETLKTF